MKLRIVCLLLGLASFAAAARLLPTSYTTTTAEGLPVGAAFNYFDDTGKQLIDGRTGVDYWAQDLGNGNAYEWVAWRVAVPTIVFNFYPGARVRTVSIGLSRAEYPQIYLPSSITINGTVFHLNGNEIADNTRTVMNFSGDWDGPLSVTLADESVTRWIFTDEFEFDGEIPEPGTVGLLAAGLAGLLALARRRK